MNTKFAMFAGRSLIAKSLLGSVLLLTGCNATVKSTSSAGSVAPGTPRLSTSASETSSSIALKLSQSSVCRGTSNFGSEGTTAWGASFGDLTASGANRDISTSQISLKSEVNQGTCSNGFRTTRAKCGANGARWAARALPAGYRAMPLVNKDHDGFLNGGGGNDGDGNPNDNHTVTLADTSGISHCGDTQATVAARVAACNYSWDGASHGNGGQGKWSLVTKMTSGAETWRDERTDLL